LHWHGLFRIVGGFFIDSDIHKVRRVMGDRWNKYHGAFVVEITRVNSHEILKKYILKHVMKEFVGEDDVIRNKFLFSKGWMRLDWKKVEGLAKTWVLGGGSGSWMSKTGWSLVNEVMESWAEKRKAMFIGKGVAGERTGYLYVESGKIREIEGGAFEPCDYSYYDS